MIQVQVFEDEMKVGERQSDRKRGGCFEEVRATRKVAVVVAAGQRQFGPGPFQNGHDVCLFRSRCHNTPTTDRSRVLTAIVYTITCGTPLAAIQLSLTFVVGHGPCLPDSYEVKIVSFDRLTTCRFSL